jgi:hypothetical protein
MAIPTAKVTLQIRNIAGLPSSTLAAPNTRYATATVQAGSGPLFSTGRTRPIPNAGGTFDLSAEAVPWTFEVYVDPSTSISISVSICEDHGDAAPPAATIISATIADPWASGTKTLGAGPSISVQITKVHVNPVDPAFLARAAAASGVSGALVVPQGFFVQISDILGVYKPSPAAVAPTPGSSRVAGYISEDNLGRIFTNRTPDGAWKNDTQYIEVKLKILAFGAPTIPAGAKIQWTILDPDDPTNDSPEFHREAGFYVDPNDYDATGHPIGAHASDNAAAYSPGNTDEAKLFGSGVSGSARWATATGGPAPAPSSSSQAQTPLTIVNPKSAVSSIRIHCTNVLGTNLRVKAELIGTPAGIPVFNATTGIMTMWSRIDAEVVRMAGAFSVAGALPTIPRFFLPVCVQLDFQLERTVSAALVRPEMAANKGLLTSSTRAWVDDPGVFLHRGQGGWFFLGAAQLPVPKPPGGRPAALYTGTTYSFGTAGTDVWIDVPGALANPDYVDINWTDGAGRAQNVGFGVDRFAAAGANTRIFLDGNDVTPLFTGHDADGSIAHAYSSQRLYFPRHELPPSGAAALPGGFGVPSAGATIDVFPPGAVFTTGISPSVPSALTGAGSFFAGRTVIFTHTPKFATGSPLAAKPAFDSLVLSTVVHEFLHAFGMPHKCGYWDWRTPRQQSCCMNYFDTWLLDSAFHPVPNTVRKNGNDMCARHLMEVRRVHLERNPGLHW